MPRRKGPPQRSRHRPTQAERRDAARLAILDAALVCFSRVGPTASMEMIAAEAGVSRTLIHYHFRHREQLVLGATYRFIEAMQQRIQELPLAGGTARARGARVLDQVWAALRAQPPHLVQVGLEVVSYGRRAGMRDQVTLHVDQVRQMVRALVAQVVAREPSDLARSQGHLGEVVVASLLGLLAWTQMAGIDEADDLFALWKSLVLTALPAR
jgi:AcrR family transcriptional regulator